MPKKEIKDLSQIILRREILKKIEECFRQVDQWGKGVIINYGIAQEYQHKAEVLIELLEVHDCGQIGGFDKGQPQNINGLTLTLVDRYNWLKLKQF